MIVGTKIKIFSGRRKRLIPLLISLTYACNFAEKIIDKCIEN